MSRNTQIGEVAAISLDFWNTLYRHRATQERREEVHSRALAVLLPRELRYRQAASVANLYLIVDEFVRRRGEAGRMAARADVVDHVAQLLGGDYGSATCAKLLDTLDDLYCGPLRPQPIPGALEFIPWAAARWPTFLISDTFMLRGAVLEQ